MRIWVYCSDSLPTYEGGKKKSHDITASWNAM